MKRRHRQPKKRRDGAELAQREHAPKPRVLSATPPYAGRDVPLERIDATRFRVPKTGLMRVDGIVYADSRLLPAVRGDRSLAQVANVATLPGIVRHSLAMPDVHWGYGFPIGGVAAFDPDRGGVVSPGGVGYDINCGVRLLVSSVDVERVRPARGALIDALFDAIPAGVGSTRPELRITEGELDSLMTRGLEWALEAGLATSHDVEHVEERGRLEGARPSEVSLRARLRGHPQLGTLGSGNHFIEVGFVDEILDEERARAFGLRSGRVTVMIHSGSRGLGHQVCADFLSEMLRASVEHGIALVDRQLSCAPIRSRPAEAYLGAMASAANFAFVNRQAMAHFARLVFARLFEAELTTVYDVCHNIAKWEEHDVEDGSTRLLLVHRKGATRALPKGHLLLAPAYRDVGQPVIIPGDMGRYSFILAGGARSAETFHSACHGAGRVLSRSASKRAFARTDLERTLRAEGVYVRGASRATVIEEAPLAYKDVAEVVEVVERAGLADPVARLRPIGVVKG